MRRIAVINHKGGVGKSTIAVNVAAALAEMQYATIIIDCDPQGDSSGLLIDNHEQLRYCVADLFAGSGVSTAELIQHTTLPALDVITSDRRVNVVERTHAFEDDPSVTALADALSEIENDYDFAIFDSGTKPHLTSYAAMVAADEVIVPCEPSQFSLRSLITIHDQLASVRRLYNPHLRIRYVLSKDVATSKKSQATRAVLTKTFGADAVFATSIPRSEAIDTAINLRKPIVLHSKRSKVAQTIRDFVIELIRPHYERTTQQTDQAAA